MREAPTVALHGPESPLHGLPSLSLGSRIARGKRVVFRRAITAGALAFVMAFYFWTSTTSDFPWRPAQSGAGDSYYNLLANAFLAGQLHLQVEPSPYLLALPDPYDPFANAAFRLHDAVLFNRKYYLYYGPTPAVLLYLPFKRLTGHPFTDPLAVALFCSVGLFFAYRLLDFLCRRYLPETPFWLRLAAVPALGFGNVAPFLLRRPAHYEVAISAAHALAFAGVYYMITGSLSIRLKKRTIALGSLLLGLATGARVPLLIVGLVSAAFVFYLLVRRRGAPFREQAGVLLAFGAPIAACVFLLGLYNYLRFHSWTNFGLAYNLQGFQSARTYKFFDPTRVPASLYYYVLAPPRFDAIFPFIHLDAGHYRPPPAGYPLESVAGILPGVPLLAVLPFLPLAVLGRYKPPFALRLVTLALVAIGLVLLAAITMTGGTMRYEVDFATFLLIPALLLWFSCMNALRNARWLRAGVAALFLCLLSVTLAIQTAASLVGYYDNLKRGSPETYEALHSFFLPLERRLSRAPQAP